MPVWCDSILIQSIGFVTTLGGPDAPTTSKQAMG